MVYRGRGGALTFNSPLKQQLDEFGRTGECSVCGQEDPAVVLLLVGRVQEVVDQQLQGGGLQTPHLAGTVLDKSAGCIFVSGGGGSSGRFSTQRDPVHRTVLNLLPPLLHWVLRTEKFVEVN